MASPEPEAVAKVDVPYVNRGLPLTFSGVNHSRWTKKQMVDIIEALRGVAKTNTTKTDLAREKRHAAKKGEGILKHQPKYRVERLRGKLELNLDRDDDLDLDKDLECGDAVVGTRRRQPPAPAQQRDGRRARGRKAKDSSNAEDEDHRQLQSSVLRKGKRRRRRKAESDLDEYSDDEVLEVLRRVHQQMEMVITGTYHLVAIILVAYRIIDEPRLSIGGCEVCARTRLVAED
jgi:hypothetical protein